MQRIWIGVVVAMMLVGSGCQSTTETPRGNRQVRVTETPVELDKAVPVTQPLAPSEPPAPHERFAGTGRVQVGDPAPEVIFDSFDDRQVATSDFRGRTTVLVLFATWCPTCRAEMDRLERDVWRKYRHDRRFTMLAAGRGDTYEAVAAYRRQHDLTLPLAGDPDGHAFAEFATKWIPRIYLIDAQGVVQYETAGFQSDDSFAYLLMKLEESLENTELPASGGRGDH